MRKKCFDMFKKNTVLWSVICKVNNLIFNKKYIKGIGNNIKSNGAILTNVDIDIIGNNNEVVISESVRLRNTKIYIRGSNHKLVIHKSARIDNTEFWFEDDKCIITVGEKTTIKGAHIAVTEPNSKISIGSDCMLSYGIDIRTGDSHSIIDLSTGKRINFAKDITIGNHVWIGAYVHILKGVTVGDNAVLGIRSVVSKDVPGNTIAAGVPAKIVKTNIDWLRERIY